MYLSVRIPERPEGRSGDCISYPQVQPQPYASQLQVQLSVLFPET